MPAVVPAHAVLRDRLRAAAQESLALSARLEEIIACKAAGPREALRGRLDHSSPPWHAAAADSILALHSWAREYEALLQARLGLPVRWRGGSDANTSAALAAIGRLADGSDDAPVHAAAAWLESWCRRAGEALGETESPRRLPRAVGAGEPCCPWCRQATLRQLALAGVIRCIDPSCRDEEGRRPSARLEMFDGEWVLRWMDGVIGCP